MRSLSRRLGPVAAAALLLGTGYFFGSQSSAPLAAQPTGKGVVPAAGTAPAAPLPATVAGDRRVIAYIHGGTPITREEFGDYLIQMLGRDRVRLYVNRRIIEAAGAKAGIVVTPQEVDAIIDQDCGKLQMDKARFVEVVLRGKYGTTLQEWREDVIRPRLIVQAMCKGQLDLSEAELRKVYENLYGEKVQCKVIMWPKDQEKDLARVYDSIRKDPAAFDDAARGQAYSDLARVGGKVDPIGRHSGPGTAKIEEIAFRLTDGQLSEMINTGTALMVIKRIHSIPPRKDVTFESVQDQLRKELADRQMEVLVPMTFARLNEEANPLFILSPRDETRKETEERSRRLGVDPGSLEKKK